MSGVDELILRTVVVQFDGKVVEVFDAPIGEPVRHHVALLAEPVVREPNRKGRSHITIGRAQFYIDADELIRLTPLLDKIREAIRASRTGATR
jgi:hypothetical protein